MGFGGHGMERSRLGLSWRKHPVITFGGAILFVLAFSAQSVVGMILLLSSKLRALQIISRDKLLMVASCVFVACLLLSVATSVLYAFSTLTTSGDAQHNLSKVSGLRKVFAAFEHAGLTSLNPVGAASDFNYLMEASKGRQTFLQGVEDAARKSPFSTGLKKTSAVIGATVSLAGVVGLSILVIGFYRKFGPGLGVWTGSSVGQKAAFVVGAVGLIVCFASLVGTFCLSLARFYVASRPIFHGSEDIETLIKKALGDIRLMDLGYTETVRNLCTPHDVELHAVIPDCLRSNAADYAKFCSSGASIVESLNSPKLELPSSCAQNPFQGAAAIDPTLLMSERNRYNFGGSNTDVSPKLELPSSCAQNPF